jgi:hypothetical protein
LIQDASIWATDQSPAKDHKLSSWQAPKRSDSTVIVRDRLQRVQGFDQAD